MTRPLVVPFVAAKGNVGRTHALLEVARVLTEKGKRVLVMDLDFTSPGVEPLAGDPRQNWPGMADLLSSPMPATWHRAVQFSDRYNCDFLGAGSLESVHRRGIPTMTPTQWRWLAKQFEDGPWEFILVDVPPGNAVFASTGVVQMLKTAAAICVLAQEGHEHGTFVQEVARQLGPDSARVLLIEALSQDSGPPKDEFWPKFLLTLQLPRLRALESPTSPAWGDARFMSAYHQLAEKLVDTWALGRAPLPPGLRKVAIAAIREGISDEPTILRHKVRPYLHPRVLVVAGRHGSGKTALAKASDQDNWAVRRLTPNDLPEGWQVARGDERWSDVWHSALGSLMRDRDPDVPVRFVWDGLDQALLERGLNIQQVRACLVSMLRIAGAYKDLEPDVDLKIFVQPAWLQDLAPLLEPRQLRSITWSAAEMFELAIRRAIRASTEFASGLHMGTEVRLSPSDPFHHENWSRLDLEATAAVLLGPQGLTAWTYALPEGDESELVPREAAELLVMALELAAKSGDRSGAVVPPHILEQAVMPFATERTGALLRKVGLTSIALLHAQQRFDRNDRKHIEALNCGLLRWTQALDGVEIPPLVQLGLGLSQI